MLPVPSLLLGAGPRDRADGRCSESKPEHWVTLLAQGSEGWGPTQQVWDGVQAFVILHVPRGCHCRGGAHFENHASAVGSWDVDGVQLASTPEFVCAGPAPAVGP